MLVNQWCKVNHFQLNLCDTGSYVSHTRGHLFTRVDGHKSKSSSVRKHYAKDHAGAISEDLLSCFRAFLHGGGGPQVACPYNLSFKFDYVYMIGGVTCHMLPHLSEVPASM